jgi:hypothetical protein
MTLHSVFRRRIPFIRPVSVARGPAVVIVETCAAFARPALGLLHVARRAMVAFCSKALYGTMTWAAEHFP